MRRILYIPAICFLILSAVLSGVDPAAAQVLHVVNAASFLDRAPLTPGSIITIFGPGIANATAGISNPGSLPTTLAGVTVTIGGQAIPLFYVSPNQINAQIPISAAAGMSALIVASPTGTFTTLVNISAAGSIGVFSLFGTGTRDGAILNAVTFKPGPFTVTTAGNPTFLAIYVTGLSLSSTPTVTIGGVPVTVQFAGNAPGYPGLEQINVQLPPSLAGAGRVEVAVTAGGVTSNITEVVILPSPGQGPLPPPAENEPRSRELAELAWIPGTHRALVSDENDDVVRVVDVISQSVTAVIDLPIGAEAGAIAVNSAGTTAVVVERDRGRAAILDLTGNMVVAEVAVGGGPSDVAIFNNEALVVNEDTDNVSVVTLNGASSTVTATIAVGRGPRAISINPSAMRAYVTNQDDGTISVLNLNTNTVGATLTLPPNSRPRNIQVIPGAPGFALVSQQSAGDGSTAEFVNLTTGAVTPANVGTDIASGLGAIAVSGATVFFADAVGGAVTIGTVVVSGGTPGLTNVRRVKVDLGPRALAVDTLDNVLLISNEGSGNIVLLSLANEQVAGRINAVRAKGEDNGKDDHDDRLAAQHLPAITSMAPQAASRGSTFTLTINGSNLGGAYAVAFLFPPPGKGRDAGGPGDGRGRGESGDHGRGLLGALDSSITVSAIAVNSAGTQLTATVQVAASAAAGARVVVVFTPNGESAPGAASTFTVQ
jgi:uncharacterized protein (TIGR03437 family)